MKKASLGSFDAMQKKLGRYQSLFCFHAFSSNDSGFAIGIGLLIFNSWPCTHLHSKHASVGKPERIQRIKRKNQKGIFYEVCGTALNKDLS
jgi:hypothetical protein